MAIAQFNQAVTGGGELSQFLRAAQSSRVDIVGIGDSNQIFLGHGWDHGWHIAVEQRLGTYATSLLALGEGEGNSAGAGVDFSVLPTISQGAFHYQGAPGPLDQFLTPGVGMRPLNYLYVPHDQTVTLQGHGVTLSATSAVRTDHPVRFHLSYGRFQGDSDGGFRPVVRLGQAPYSVVVESEELSTTGGPAIDAITMDVEGTPDRPALQLLLGRYNSDLAGPFVGYTVRAEQTNRHHGAAFSTLYGYGGQSARDMAEALSETSEDYLARYLDQLRSIQGPEKFILIRINTGLNDRNESLPPVDGTDAPPSSPQAYAANLRFIISKFRQVWNQQEWDETELYFLITPSHPVSDPDEEILQQYRLAAHTVASEFSRCAAIDFTKLTNSEEIRTSGWYRSSIFDRNHLNRPGYEALALRELDALLTYTSCPDIDGDGIIGLSDLNAILANFGQSSAATDLTGDGFIDLTDLNALLQAFGTSCEASSQD